MEDHHHGDGHKKGSLSLFAAVAMAVVKVLGIPALAVAGLWASGSLFETVTQTDQEPIEGIWGFLTATAIGILAYKCFTTITTIGDEVTKPKKNVGRAIMISIGGCVVVNVLVGFAVAKAAILITAIAMDAAVLGALLVTKGGSDPLVLIVLAIGSVLIFGGDWWFLRNKELESNS